jgi:hypothetical protein
MDLRLMHVAWIEGVDRVDYMRDCLYSCINLGTIC